MWTPTPLPRRHQHNMLRLMLNRRQLMFSLIPVTRRRPLSMRFRIRLQTTTLTEVILTTTGGILITTAPRSGSVSDMEAGTMVGIAGAIMAGITVAGFPGGGVTVAGITGAGITVAGITVAGAPVAGILAPVAGTTRRTAQRAEAGWRSG